MGNLYPQKFIFKNAPYVMSALYVWGNNASGQLGIGSTTNYNTPLGISNFVGGSSFTIVAGGIDHNLLITSSGKLYTWGNNAYGQLGNGNTNNVSTPTQVITDKSFTIAAVAGNTSLAITNTGTLWAWGNNASYQIGDGTTTNRSSPVQVTGGIPTLISDSWRAICSDQTSGYNQFAIKASDYSLWAFGSLNSSGNIGNNTVTAVISPVQIGTSSWQAIASGQGHAIGITVDGKLFGWGNNSAGQVGIGSFTNTSSPIQIGASGSSWTIVSVSGSSCAAIDTKGGLWTWGLSNFGTLGNNQSIFVNVNSPVQVGTSSWTKVSTGGGNALGITADGGLWAWGNNSYGQLGNNSTISTSSPVKIGTSSWSAVSAGYSWSTAIDSVGRLFTWGVNGSGQLGLNNTTSYSSPVQVGTSSWTKVSAGFIQTQAIRADGTLWGFGTNAQGQLGTGTVGLSYSSPVQIGTSSWSAVCAGYSWAYGLTSNGLWYGWGYNGGYPNTTNPGAANYSTVSSPVVIQSVSGPKIYDYSFSIVSSGYGNFCYAVGTTTQTLYTWGQNNAGQLGLAASNITSPSAAAFTPSFSMNASWKQIAQGYDHVLGISTDGSLYSWGSNNYYQGGGSVTTSSSNLTALNIPDTKSWTAVAAGTSYSMGIQADGSLWAWGYNNFGDFGDNTINVFATSPVRVGTSSWTAISIGGSGFSSFGIKIDRSLWAWGSNPNGLLGINDTLATTTYNTSSPVQIGTSSWNMVSAGISVITAIKADGSLWTWGQNTNGQLGINNADGLSYSSPVQIGTSSWTMVSSGAGFSMGIKPDGSLWAWGINTYGQLGQNNTTTYSSPVQVGNYSYIFVSAGLYETAAIRNDGALFTVGYNNYGQLGLNNTTSYSSPVQVGTSSWTAVYANRQNYNQSWMQGILSNGSKLYSWGQNAISFGGAGFLAVGDILQRSSPTLITSIATTSGSAISKIVTTNSGSAAFLDKAGLVSTIGNNTNYELGVGSYNTNKIAPGTVVLSTATLQKSSNLSSIVSIAAGNNYFVAANTNQASIWGYDQEGYVFWPTTVQSRTSGGVSWKSISIGGYHGAAITSTGQLYTWGRNDSTVSAGGNNTTVNLSALTKIGTSSWTMVSCGGLHVAGIDASGKLFTWGSGANYSQLGNGVSLASSPVQVGTLSWSMVSAGAYHTAAIDTTGSLWTWGWNTSGQLGNYSAGNFPLPWKVGVNYITQNSWKAISMGVSHSAAISSDGSLYTWGGGNAGQLGLNNTASIPVPQKIGSSSWTAVSVGDAHTLGIKLDGTLWAWGTNSYGQIGNNNGALGGYSSPVQIGTETTWSTITAGPQSSFGIRSNNLYAWGINAVGQLGDGTVTTRSSPVQIGTPLTSSWTKVSAGPSHTAAIAANGSLWVWGYNAYGQLGNNNVATYSQPQIIGSQVSTTSWKSVTATRYVTAMIRNDGALFMYGLNTAGNLGNNSVANVTFPVQIGTSSWSSVSVSESHTLAIRADNTMWAWGLNTSGQLGDGTVTNRSSPVQIGANTNWKQVVAGQNSVNNNAYSLAIDNTGALFGWGNQASAVIDTNRSSPVQIGLSGTFSSWSFVSAKGGVVAAIKPDGTMYTWGYCQYGEMGSGQQYETRYYGFTPFIFKIDGSWSKVSTGTTHILAIRTDGSLWSWGDNQNGQLGAGSFTARSSPAQVGSSSWSICAAGYQNSYIINPQGKLYGMGLNQYTGQLGVDGSNSIFTNFSLPTTVGTSSWSMVDAGNGYGIGSVYNATQGSFQLYGWGNQNTGSIGNGTGGSSSSPVAITSGATYNYVYNSFSLVSAGLAHTMAIKPDGSLWAWGYNADGRLGTYNTTSYSSPVQVGTSSWTMVTASTTNSLLLDINGKLYATGYNYTGLLGNPSNFSNYSSPVQIGTSSWSMLASINGSATTTGALLINQSLYTWGGGSSGQLGNGSSVSVTSPVAVGITTGATYASWTTASAGTNHTLAIQSNGSLWAWGGATVNGNSVAISSPVQIGTSSWSKVSAGLSSSAAIRTDGALFTWGLGSYGILGLGSSTSGSYSSPQQVGTSSWSLVSVGDSAVAGITSDNRLFTWGYNNAGVLGQNSGVATTIYSPIQIGTSSWFEVCSSSAGNTMIARDSNNQLYGWGTTTTLNSSDYFALPLNKAINFMGNQNAVVGLSSPILLSSSYTPIAATQIASGLNHVLITDSSNSLYAWGFNNFGQVGAGNTSPITYPGNAVASWGSVNGIYAGGNHSFKQ
jgi:alpha-tubulin suppressor-like RCC1 family protein